MWWIRYAFFMDDLSAVVVFTVAVIVLTLAAAIAVQTDRSGIYLGLCAILVGGIAFAVSVGAAVYAEVCFSVLLFMGGCIYLVVLAIIAWKHKRAERKRAAEERAKRLQFTLPDRDNSFVRARLHTVLQPKDAEEEAEDVHFRLSYAQKLIVALKAADLSVVDRLRLEETEKIFSVYLKKQTWTVNEVRALSETFSFLLKLSAKYSVSLKNERESEITSNG